MAIDIEEFANQYKQASTQPGFDPNSFSRQYQKGSNNFSRNIAKDTDQSNKGFFTETAEALAGGATDAAELWMRAIRTIDPEGGNDAIRNFATFGLDSIKNFVAKHPSLAPSPEIEKGVKRWWVEGVRSLVPSLSTTLPAVVGGAVAAPFTGGATLPGISAGAGALSGAIFGLAEFDKFHEEVEDRIVELGMSPEEAQELRVKARNPAIFSALTEGGLEAAANALQVLTLGRFTPARKGAANIAKASIKSLFTKTPKEALKSAGKKLAVSAATETSTEFAQSALETKFRRDIGLTDMDSISAGFQAMGPAFVTSLLFFGGGQGVNSLQRYTIRKNLEDAKADRRNRAVAVRQIADVIRASGDPDARNVAENFSRAGKHFIENEKEINIDTEVGFQNMLGEYANGLREKYIDLPIVRKIVKGLKEDLKRPHLKDEDRAKAERMAFGIEAVANDFEVWKKERDEFKKDLNSTKEKKTEADKILDISRQVLGLDVDIDSDTKPKAPKAKETTKDIQEQLILNGRKARGEDVEADRKEAEFINEKRIIEDRIKAEAKKEREVAKGTPEEQDEAEQRRIETDISEGIRADRLAEREGRQTEVEKTIARQKAILNLKKDVDKHSKNLTEEEADQFVGAIETSDAGSNTIDNISKVIKTGSEDHTDILNQLPEKEQPPEEEPQAEPPIKTLVTETTPETVIPPEEIKPITKEQERDIKRELKDPDITPEERTDLENILREAGLPVEKKAPVKPPKVKKEKKTTLEAEIQKIIAKKKGVAAAPKVRGKGVSKEGPKDLNAIEAELGKSTRLLGQITNAKPRRELVAKIKDLQKRRDELRANVIETGLREPKVEFDSKSSKRTETALQRAGRTTRFRRDLTVPTRSLIEQGLIKGNVLHHGSGKASVDSVAMGNAANSVSEFDINHANFPENLKKKYDTIVSNYVLNTIPLAERTQAVNDIKGALKKKGVAYISVRGVGDTSVKGKKEGDGVITGIGTFQKAFTPQQITDYLKGFFSHVEIILGRGTKPDNMTLRVSNNPDIKTVAETMKKLHPEIDIDQAGANAVAWMQTSKLESGVEVDASNVDEMGVRTLGVGISPEFMHKGQVELKGKNVQGAKDIATISQVFRNPMYETLRVMYVKGRKILDHEGITSRMPGVVRVFKGDMEAVEKRREAMGADRVYLVHNHPSGDPSPSVEDTNFTKGTSDIIKGFAGHVVIDSGRFAYINPEGNTSIQEIETDDRILEASIPHKLLGKRVKNHRDIAEATKQLMTPSGFITALYTSASLDIRGIQEIPIDIARNPVKLARHVRKKAKDFGAGGIAISLDADAHKNVTEIMKSYIGLVETETLLDVVVYNAGGSISLRSDFGVTPTPEANTFLGEKVESIQVREEQAEFGKEEKADFKSQEKKPLKVDESRLDKSNWEGHSEAKDIALRKLGPAMEGRTLKEKFNHFTSNLKLRLRQGFIDQYASLKVLDNSLWKLIQVTSSVNGAVETLFNWGGVRLDKSGVLDILNEEGGRGLRDVLKPLGNEVDRWLSWIAGNRADELIKPTKEHPKGREKNLDQDEIDKLKKLSEGNMPDGKSRLSVYRKANKELMKLHQSVLDVGVQTGTINKQERESWTKDFYLPFFRFLQEKNEVRGPKTMAGITNQDAIKQLKGAGTPVADMLTNIMLNWNHILRSSMNNQASSKALKIATEKTIEGGVPVASRVSDDVDVIETEDGKFTVLHVPSEKTRGTYETYDEAIARADQIVDAMAQARAAKGDKVVYVRDNGKKVWYEVNEPNVYNALTSMQWEGMNSSTMKTMRKFKRMMTAGVTLSPDFKIRNLIRDTVSSLGVSNISLNIFNNVFGTGLKSTAKNSAEMARRRAGGGSIEFGHVYGTDPEREALQIRRNLKKENILDNAKGIAKFRGKAANVLRSWNDLGNRTENLNRGALFVKNVKEGKSLLEANFQARDLLDLNRHGAYPAVRFMIDVVPFMNARIQGLDKLGRAFVDSKESRNRAIAVISTVGMASALLYLTYKDDEDFKAREEWDRDTYWWFKLPGDDTAFRLPKPFEIGAIGTLFERLVEQFADDKIHGELFVERAKFALTQTFSFDAMPQMFKPIIELLANKSFFTDRPIETLGMQRLSPTERRKAWSSETTILLSQALSKIPWDKVQLSPVQVEHLIQGYFGWAGATTLGFVDQVLTQPIGGFPGRPSRRIEETPLVGSFIRTTPARQTKYSTLFYEQLKEMNQTYADIRNFRTLGEIEKAFNLAKKEKDNLRFRKFANKIQKRIAETTKRIRLTRLNKDMSSKEKRIKIDRLTEIKNRLLKMAVEKIKL